jgi:hypothetical protein
MDRVARDSRLDQLFVERQEAITGRISAKLGRYKLKGGSRGRVGDRRVEA